MNHELTGDSDREERRNHVLLAYVEALEEGREPDRAQLLAAHPDLRQDLETFLAGHDEVARLTAASAPRSKATPVAPSADARGAGRHPSGHRRARRLSPPARGGPWGDGRRLRGGTDLAPAAGRAQGPAVRRGHRPAPPPAVQDRGAGRGARAARADRSGARGRLRARRPLLRDAVHRRAEPRRADWRAPSPPRRNGSEPSPTAG